MGKPFFLFPRIVVFGILAALAAFPAAAAQSTLVDKALAEAVNITPQPDEQGLTDVLFELREERGNSTLLVLTHFPQGLGPRGDAAIASLARAMHGAAYVEVQEQSDYALEQYVTLLSESAVQAKAPPAPEPKSWSNSYAAVTTWQAFRPSGSHISLLFRESRSGGGAHGNWSYRALTLDLANGRELGLADVFPGAQAPKNLVAARVLAALQSRKALAGAEETLLLQDIDVGMDRMALTPEGLRIVYAPYETGSYAEGEFVLDIARDEAVKMGALPSLWQ